MIVRDIPVHADNGASAKNRLETAAKLAAAHGAHLVALHIRHRPFNPVDVMATGWSKRLSGYSKSSRISAQRKRNLLSMW